MHVILRNKIRDILYAEMPTSGNLKSGDFSFITTRYQTTVPSPSEEKGDVTSSPSNRPPCPQNRLFSLTLKSSEGFLSWPKVELKSSDDFPILAQRIRKVSKVHQDILKTNGFLIYWLTDIQSDNLLNGRENEESVCLVSFEVWFLVKRLLDLKKSSRNDELSLKKNEIVLIRVHLETEC